MGKPRLLVTLVTTAAAVLTALSTATAVSRAQEPPLSIQGFSDVERRVFLAGMAQGLTYLRTMQRYGRDFCLPPGGQLSGDYLWNLMSERVRGPRRIETVGPMVTSLLSERFPCPDVEAVAVTR